MTKDTNAVKPIKTSENPKGWFRPKSEIKTLDMTSEIERGYREDREWFEKHKGSQVLMAGND